MERTYAAEEYWRAEQMLRPRRAMLITGVIDFDSAGVGDPAMDLAAALTGPASFARCFTRVYPVTEEIMRRVRFYQGTFALQEALFGIETGDHDAFRSGIDPYR